MLTQVTRWQKKKKSACNVGDTGSIPGSGRYPGERNGNPLAPLVFFPGKFHGQKSLADYTVHGVAKGGRDLATEQQ